MSMFSGIMSGSCMVLVPGTTTYNEFGEPIPGSDTEAGPYKCYFFQPEGKILDVMSGQLQKKSVRVMLPASVQVSVGQKIRGLVTGYTESYSVLSVEAAHHLDVLDHWECDLEIVQ